MNKLKYILKELGLSNLKRIYTNYKCINSTTIIGKARLQNVVVRQYCSFADNSFVIGSNISDFTSIGRNSSIINADIGKFCSISWNVTIGATKHHMNRISTHAFPYITNYGFSHTNNKIVETTYVGNDVWIGANAVIMPNIKIGNGAVIGAGSIVTKDVAEYAIVTGSPAKIIGFRFNDERRNEINSLEWWNWDISKLKENIEMFRVSQDVNDHFIGK